ncbi:protein of unknown function [Methylorubrum extorquens DM4]|uniref:Uncharacterized protein n=1 Tax=Methylorubrum extorquens (strain DSM 6343 / CIP 106787 / DM4) TaxID=661410 RepID=C7CB97_METED|nr:protein of unknown function [Methylorubrum extorquens DM4]
MPDRPEAPREFLDRYHLGNDTDGYRAAICQMGVEPPKGGGQAALTLSPRTEPKNGSQRVAGSGPASFPSAASQQNGPYPGHRLVDENVAIVIAPHLGASPLTPSPGRKS